MKTNTKNTTTQTNEEIIADLRKQLEDSKNKANGCKTSTLEKVGKATLGIGLLAAAAAGGFYYGIRNNGDTTIVVSE